MMANEILSEEERALAAEYALGVLPHGERIAFDQQMKSDTALKREVEAWDRHFISLALDYEPVQPPRSVLTEVEKRLFDQPAQLSGETSWLASLWSNVGLWRGFSALAATAAIVLALNLGQPIAPPAATDGPLLVAQIESENQSLKLLSVFDAQSNTLRLTRVAGIVPAGRDQELWLIDEAGTPVSLGLLPRGDNGTLSIEGELAERFDADITLAVSDEPEGGSPTGAPTGAVLATASPLQI